MEVTPGNFNENEPARARVQAKGFCAKARGLAPSVLPPESAKSLNNFLNSGGGGD